MPPGPPASLDLSARLLKFGEGNPPGFPTTFNQDHRSTSPGLALKL